MDFQEIKDLAATADEVTATLPIQPPPESGAHHGPQVRHLIFSECSSRANRPTVLRQVPISSGRERLETDATTDTSRHPEAHTSRRSPSAEPSHVPYFGDPASKQRCSVTPTTISTLARPCTTPGQLSPTAYDDGPAPRFPQPAAILGPSDVMLHGMDNGENAMDMDDVAGMTGLARPDDEMVIDGQQNTDEIDQNAVEGPGIILPMVKRRAADVRLTPGFTMARCLPCDALNHRCIFILESNMLNHKGVLAAESHNACVSCTDLNMRCVPQNCE